MGLDAIDIQTLIIADILGSITPEEKIQLNKLMAEDREVRFQYEYIQKELASEGTQVAGQGYATADQLIAIAGKRKRNKIVRVFAAASAILILGGGLLYYINPSMKADSPALVSDNMIRLTVGDKKINLETDALEMNANGFLLHSNNKTLTYTGASDTYNTSTLTVPSGKDYKVILSDGSTVILNSASTLEFPMTFHGNTREIRITGEAFFKIAKNTQPFIVHTPNSDVQVLGTEFNVNTYDSGTVKVALVEGSVKMNASGSSVLLKPGNAATFAGEEITVNPFDQEEILDRQKGIFRFPDGVTIDEIAKAIPRYSGVKLIVDQSAAGKKFLGITYNRNKPIEYFMEQLNATKEIISYKEGEVIHLK
jgi:hypothetical protein